MLSLHVVLVLLMVGYMPIIPHMELLLGRDSKSQAYFYQNMLNFQLRIDKSLRRGSILFFGDSLIQGLCVSCISGSAQNFGIGKDTSEKLVTRLKLYSSIKNSTSVFVQIGHNDLQIATNDKILKNFKSLILTIPFSAKLTLISLFPIDNRIVTNPKKRNERILLINAKVQNLCDEHAHCQFIDVNSLLTDTHGNLKDIYHIGDGIHLNETGASIVIQKLRQFTNDGCSYSADD